MRKLKQDGWFHKRFKKPTKKIENGMLYVFVEPDKTEEEIKRFKTIGVINK